VTRRFVSGLLSGLLTLLLVGAPQAAPEPPIVAFDRFVNESNPVCQSRRAAECVARAWRFADADGNGGLSLQELEALRADLEVWAIWRQAELAAHERSGIAFGLWLVDSIGLDYLHAAYDADNDGLISRSELLADVHLDERPIGTVLLDPVAVDHAAIARRLGLPPAVLDQLPLDPPD
jgi:EF hand